MVLTDPITHDSLASAVSAVPGATTIRVSCPDDEVNYEAALEVAGGLVVRRTVNLVPGEWEVT